MILVLLYYVRKKAPTLDPSRKLVLILTPSYFFDAVGHGKSGQWTPVIQLTALVYLMFKPNNP